MGQQDVQNVFSPILACDKPQQLSDEDFNQQTQKLISEILELLHSYSSIDDEHRELSYPTPHNLICHLNGKERGKVLAWMHDSRFIALLIHMENLYEGRPIYLPFFQHTECAIPIGNAQFVCHAVKIFINHTETLLMSYLGEESQLNQLIVKYHRSNTKIGAEPLPLFLNILSQLNAIKINPASLLRSIINEYGYTEIGYQNPKDFLEPLWEKFDKYSLNYLAERNKNAAKNLSKSPTRRTRRIREKKPIKHQPAGKMIGHLTKRRVSESQYIFSGLLDKKINPKRLNDNQFNNILIQTFVKLHTIINLHKDCYTSHLEEYRVTVKAIVSEVFEKQKYHKRLAHWINDHRFMNFIVFLNSLRENSNNARELLAATFFEDTDTSDDRVLKFQEIDGLNNRFISPYIEVICKTFIGNYIEYGPGGPSCLERFFSKNSHEGANYFVKLNKLNAVYQSGSEQFKLLGELEDKIAKSTTSKQEIEKIYDKIKSKGLSRRHHRRVANNINRTAGSILQHMIVGSHDSPTLRASSILKYFCFTDKTLESKDTNEKLEIGKLLFDGLFEYRNQNYRDYLNGDPKERGNWDALIIKELLSALSIFVRNSYLDDTHFAYDQTFFWVKSSYEGAPEDEIFSAINAFSADHQGKLYQIYLFLLEFADSNTQRPLNEITGILALKFKKFREAIELLNDQYDTYASDYQQIRREFVSAVDLTTGFQPQRIEFPLILKGEKHHGATVVSHVLHKAIDNTLDQRKKTTYYKRAKTTSASNTDTINDTRNAYLNAHYRLRHPEPLTWKKIALYAVGAFLLLGGLAAIGFLTVSTLGLIHLAWIIPISIKASFGIAGSSVVAGGTLLTAADRDRRTRLKTRWNHFTSRFKRNTPEQPAVDPRDNMVTEYTLNPELRRTLSESSQQYTDGDSITAATSSSTRSSPHLFQNSRQSASLSRSSSSIDEDYIGSSASSDSEGSSGEYSPTRVPRGVFEEEIAGEEGYSCSH